MALPPSQRSSLLSSEFQENTSSLADDSLEAPTPHDAHSVVPLSVDSSEMSNDLYGQDRESSAETNFTSLLSSVESEDIGQHNKLRGQMIRRGRPDLICGIRRCVILELISLLSLVMGTVDYLVFNEVLFPYLHIVFMISSLLYVSYEMYFRVFRHVANTFQACIILVSVTLIVAIDVMALLSHWNTDNNRTGHNTALDQIVRDCQYLLAIIFFMATDCVVYLSNFTRFSFPMFVACNTLYNLYLTFATPLIFASETIISYEEGSVTLTDVRQACLLNIFVFCLTGVMAIFRDWPHQYFLLLHARLKREKIFKMSHRRKEWFYEKQYHRFSGFCNAWKCILCVENWSILCVTKWNEFWIVFMSFVLEIIYLVGNTNIYMRVLLAVIICILVLRLILRQFDINMLPHYMMQFRAWLLLAACLGVLVCDVSDCFIRKDNDVVCYHSPWLTMSDGVYYSARVVLVSLRDGMHLTWLFSFVLACQVLGETVYNIFGMYFLWVDYDWVVYARKACYLQIFSLMLLVLYSLFKDVYHTNCVLIVRRGQRARVFDLKYNSGNYGFFSQKRSSIQRDIKNAKTQAKGSIAQMTKVFQRDSKNKMDDTEKEQEKQRVDTKSIGKDGKTYTIQLNDGNDKGTMRESVALGSSYPSTSNSDVGRGLSEFYSSIVDSRSIVDESQHRDDSY